MLNNTFLSMYMYVIQVADMKTTIHVLCQLQLYSYQHLQLELNTELVLYKFGKLVMHNNIYNFTLTYFKINHLHNVEARHLRGIIMTMIILYILCHIDMYGFNTNLIHLHILHVTVITCRMCKGNLSAMFTSNVSLNVVVGFLHKFHIIAMFV